MLDKTYRPAEVEAKLYSAWERSGAFRAGGANGERIGAKPYTIVIPPPNVTGSLHMGHALNNTLQDALVRFERMRGRDTLWQPGTDHAGIATQMVVERQLEAQKLSRRDMGRDAFIERVWKWKAESGGLIGQQLRRLGASCDWERERFTMDEGLSKAVLKVFVDLYKRGLIYRDKRLVNWDPKLLTAISDLEVDPREVNGKLWYFKYPIVGPDGQFVTIATTRPETMLGDTAVAVHPEDGRHRHLVGSRCRLPIAERDIPIVADSFADPEKGSGAVKITPAHDFNDFEVAKRHGLPMINILDREARLNENVPQAYRGLDRFAARAKVVEAMTALGLVDRVENNRMTVPYGDRSGVIVEPWLTDQWFVDAKRLAGPAIQAVEDGRTVFVPKHWENTFFEWMRNIQPWCISRQIWWGHQIPAWYGPDGRVFVEMSEAEAGRAAQAHYGRPVALERDADVLDTWFSSALWPFSTLGWPDRTPELGRYYPTDVLVTGFDIIFFWVARMMMMGLHFQGEVPFRTVYIHALVRDARGQKMSKSKGNVIDPLELFDKFGTDAVRFTLAALAVQGRDIKLSEARVEGYRNFATKLWNAARYAQMNGCRPEPKFDPAACAETVNRWIVGKTAAVALAVTREIEAYRFNEAAGALYQFLWGTFCDWYLEFTKPVLAAGGEAAAETRGAAAWVLEQALKLLHPFMPFETEELWRELGYPGPLITAPWPDLASDLADARADAELDWLVRLISEVRSVRSDYNVEPGREIAIGFREANAATLARLGRYASLVKRLARVRRIERDVSDLSGKGTIQIVVAEATVYVHVAEVIDRAAEIARLENEVAKRDDEIARVDKKLADPAFVAKAPEEVVEEQRERRAEHAEARAKFRQALDRLRAA